MANVDPVRDCALRVLLRVFERGAFLDLAADATLKRYSLSSRGRRFFTQLVYGTVRHKLLIDYVLKKYLYQPLDKLPPAIITVLRMGTFQALFCNQVTPPALVHTSVELAKKYGHAGTARLVNAVLRKIPRHIDEIKLPNPEENPVYFLSLRYSVPEWLVKLWISELGEQATHAMCKCCNEPAPLSIRVNTRRISTNNFKQILVDKGFSVEKQTEIPEELTFHNGAPSLHSKWFNSGFYIIQDPAAMIGTHLLDPKPGEIILDMCAAPGGKTTHISQLTDCTANIIALDVHWSRTKLICENVSRLGLFKIKTICANALYPPFHSILFDRVLVDAPCTGLGTLRRHPDLKWRLTIDDIERCAIQQEKLLRKAIELCKNGGVIVYGVCTTTLRETEDIISRIIKTEPVILDNGPQWLDTWKKEDGIYQILPFRDNMDGFFWTRLRKQS